MVYAFQTTAAKTAGYQSFSKTVLLRAEWHPGCSKAQWGRALLGHPSVVGKIESRGIGRRWGIGLAGALLGGIAVLVPGRVAADHDHASVGVVAWLGQGEVVLAADGQYHVLRITDRTAMIDEFGRPLGRLRSGDRVRERCRPTAEGRSVTIRIEIERSAGLDAEDAHA